MKVIQKFILFSLTAAILMAASGFRMIQQHCPGDQKSLMNFIGNAPCCCDKPGQNQPAPDSACQDMTCIVQAGFTAYSSPQSSTKQTSKCLQAPAAEALFTQTIRPALLERIPHVTLPPPASGRFRGILHQTFII